VSDGAGFDNRGGASAAGRLAVGDGHELHWEAHGPADGAPCVVLHGGPGSGAAPWWTELFDLRRHRVVLFDQRGCGRSTPDAGRDLAALRANTTHHLVTDIERLREQLGVDRWLVVGGSWGTTLALAYAERHPGRVRGLVLFSVALTTRAAVAWATRGVGRYFPAEWRRFRDGVPAPERDGDLAAAYARLLADPDPAVREAAARRWCAWDDRQMRAPGTASDPRYDDPVFRLRSARLVTHYWSHAAWLGEDELVEGASRIAAIPAVLVHGRLDVGAPLEDAWRLAERWPAAELVVVEDAGHGAGAAIGAAVRAGVARLAGPVPPGPS
jgi:proline iminopeptidase